GNYGSTRRFSYSAVGDAVNVAARLEEETQTYGYSILLGPDTAEQASDLATLPLDRITVRGRTEALQVHALVGDDKIRNTPAFRELRDKHMQLRGADSRHA